MLQDGVINDGNGLTIFNVHLSWALSLFDNRVASLCYISLPNQKYTYT